MMQGNERENRRPIPTPATDPLTYVNPPPPPSFVDSLSDSYLSHISFNVQPDDVRQPWFHKHATRETAAQLLASQPAGTFLIRPSSQKGSYALSWVRDSGEVEHQLIFGLFPGYSLAQKPSPEERFPSLTSLVSSCSFLSRALPNSDADSNAIQQNLKKSGTEVVGRIVELLRNNVSYFADKNLTELSWRLCILEGPPSTASEVQRCEQRTFVRYSQEEYVAPDLLPLRESTARLVFDALKTNDSLVSLSINGHKGFMLKNYTQNIGDTEAMFLAYSLKANRSLTMLDLSVNGIGDEGATHLAQALRANRSLKRLILSYNFIKADGLVALAQALRTNSTLEELDLGVQLLRSRNSVTLGGTVYEKLIASLIGNSLLRRKELFDASILPCFHGYLLPLQAEQLVRAAAASVSPAGGNAGRGNSGPYLMYLNERRAWCVNICEALPGGEVVHTPLWVVPAGYSHTRSPEIPTLFEHCAWYLAGNPSMLENVSLPSEVAERLAAFKNFIALWSLKEIPSKEKASAFANSYPSLSAYVKRCRPKGVPVRRSGAPGSPAC